MDYRGWYETHWSISWISFCVSRLCDSVGASLLLQACSTLPQFNFAAPFHSAVCGCNITQFSSIQCKYKEKLPPAILPLLSSFTRSLIKLELECCAPMSSFSAGTVSFLSLPRHSQQITHSRNLENSIYCSRHFNSGESRNQWRDNCSRGQRSWSASGPHMSPAPADSDHILLTEGFVEFLQRE